MRKLIVFNHVTLDGYFVGANGDFSWAHTGNDDPEYSAWVAGNAGGDAEFLFGRVTYDLMAGYWPSPMAAEHSPAVAEAMNSRKKVVFSRTMDKAVWNNTTLMKGDLVSEVRKMKAGAVPDILIFGSGSIISQLAPEGLVDVYQVVINPVVLGKGRTMFEGIAKTLNLKLTETKAFKNGKVFLSYEAAA